MIFLKKFETSSQTLQGVGKCHIPQISKDANLNGIIYKKMDWVADIPLALFQVFHSAMFLEFEPHHTFYTFQEVNPGSVIPQVHS
jgi:hypothetical protein